MKHVVKIIALTYLLPPVCCGQQVIWQNHYGGNQFEVIASSYGNACRLLRNSNNQYLIAGGAFGVGNSGSQHAIKVDDLGNLLWQVYEEGHPYEIDNAETIIKTFDSNYFMVGWANMQEVNPNNIRLTKFTEQGNVIFSKVIIADSLYSTSAKDICYTQDSNYIVACASDYDICLVKLNENGDTLWTSTPMPDSLGYWVPYCFQPAPDFSAYYGVARNNGHDYYWFKTDTAGQLLDLKEIKYPDQFDITLYKAAMLANGNMLVLGGSGYSYQQVCSPNSDFHFLFEYNQYGEVVREKVICYQTWENIQNANLILAEFLVAEDGSIYFCRNKWLYKLNANWEAEWAYELDIPENTQLMKLAQFEYGYLIAAGQIQLTPDDIDIFMCKIALPEAISVHENEAFKFNAYPNPTNGQLTLESSLPGITSYTILTIDGRLITQGSFTTKTTLDLISLSAGAYYLHLQDHEGNRVYGQVISKQ